MSKTKDRFYNWLANHLPRRVVYHCAIRLGVHATSGKYSSTVVPELNFMDAVGRWEGMAGTMSVDWGEGPKVQVDDLVYPTVPPFYWIGEKRDGSGFRQTTRIPTQFINEVNRRIKEAFERGTGD